MHHLARLELVRGRLVRLDLPVGVGAADRGGFADVAAAARFFGQHLLGTPDDRSVRAYLGLDLHLDAHLDPAAGGAPAGREALLATGLVTGRLRGPASGQDPRWAAARRSASFASGRDPAAWCVQALDPAPAASASTSLRAEHRP